MAIIDKNKQDLSFAIAKASGLEGDKILSQLQKPKNTDFGDLAFPCFELAKLNKMPPPQAANELSEKLELPACITEATVTGPFINFRIDRTSFIKEITTSRLEDVLLSCARSEKILLEYSSPNIAKTFHVGHLRTTLIGNCLDKVFRKAGHDVISMNHLGDWGTQFGFVWAGCELWGKPEEPTVRALVELYKKATGLKERQENEEIAEDEKSLPDINEMARKYFIDLESGEDYAKNFWQWCLDVSMKYLVETYTRLGIHFDHYLGESFYSDMLDGVTQEFKDSGILVESKGALGVELEDDLGFARIATPDGRSLYLTRDIASADYRASEFGFDRAVYVVGAPQTLHFQQLVGVLKALGKDYAEKIIHVPFGHVIGMKTRGAGGAVELNDFFNEAFDLALTAYKEQVTKRPEGLDENIVADRVGMAAVIYGTLSRSRHKDVQFSWDHALEFQGDSGPYILYACARINGIKENAAEQGVSPNENFNPELLTEDSAFQLARMLDGFEAAANQTMKEYEPAHLAAYGLELAKQFSKAYLDLKVVGVEKDLAQARLSLFEATRMTLETTLHLLGIEPLERM